ncbi:ComEA family DNA-binding protein [Deinococcus sonorensis]|uniref:Helix-hairpin-helix domain-containing protein n=2 Tax=Deinococcus sonorensis TaxID=309891 RepID=A0AAU7UEC7_9DEIO
MLQSTDARWTTALIVAALLCGGWALWPVVAPASAPQVSHQPLPLPPAEAAPEYRTTGSITPLISGRLDLNTATEEQLEALPKIGPALAQRLRAGRPYHSLADLDRVKGVGPALLQTLEPLVRF